LNKGHYKWGKNVGIFQYTESITVLTSTSTSCDLYTAYLENQYQFIQQQVAQGTGAQLDALAHYSGCKKQAVPSFRKTLYANYEALFGSKQDPEILQNQILEFIETTPSLSESCSIKQIPELQKALS
ncbi:MAG: DUF3015 family protein, partial [SAR324 cluster bacterium]|nr:DUF3015 family protein [SAR324 cluster bacterium]